MKVKIHSIRGGVKVGDMPDVDVMAMLDAYRAGEEVLTVSLDNGGSVSHILRANICRIDVEES